jgi:hypothetical protein
MSSLFITSEVLSPIICIFTTSLSISKISPTFIEPSKSKIIPEMKSLNVFCKPSPIPTSNAADQANKTLSFNPLVSKIISIAKIQITYLII